MTLTIDTEHGRETGDAAANLRAIGAKADAWLREHGYPLEREPMDAPKKTHKPLPKLERRDFTWSGRGRRPVPVTATAPDETVTEYPSIVAASEALRLAGFNIFVGDISTALKHGWKVRGYRFVRAA